MIPGLQIHAECSYAEEVTQLTAGTLCQCMCGEQAVWRNRAFYGDVVNDKERECIEELCPMVNPVPGLMFKAHCVYDQHLFALPALRKKPTEEEQKESRRQLRGMAAVLVGAGALIACSLVVSAGVTDYREEGERS
mmetsp:Transcript_42197/g.109158  ORF Transcript_42197/g.109158 Transcript_42197/m.109158 type:complete len:136 (-) Transcript_42197:74-481(-)